MMHFRSHRFVSALAVIQLVGCTDDSMLPPPIPEPNTLTITTPAFTLAPGQETTLCYYTTVPSDVAVGVKRYASSMSPGSHHMILFTTTTAIQPDGTLGPCGGTSAGSLPVWSYAAQEPESETAFPDGVGVVLAARQPIMIQMHYFNLGDEDIDAAVTLEITTYGSEETFEKAAAYVTFNTLIDVPPNGTQTVGGSCAVPPGAKFFAMSTHSHSFTTRAEVRDGAAMVVETLDWEHPGYQAWAAAPFYTFASGNLDYRCDYRNTTAQSVKAGDSAITDEMCMAVGYFFPSENTITCVNSSVISL